MVWRKNLMILLLLLLLTSVAAFGDAIDDFLKANATKILPTKKADLSSLAHFEDDNILFVDSGSTAQWKLTEDSQGYLYVMVRSGAEGEGTEYLMPQILYEIKVNEEPIPLKRIDIPSKLLHTGETWNVYSNWIQSEKPLLLSKDSSLSITSWVDWGIVHFVAVCPKEFTAPVREVRASSTQTPESIFSGQSKEPPVQLSQSPDMFFEEHPPHHVAAKDTRESQNVRVEKNSLHFSSKGAEAVWEIQEPVQGYLYFKVRAGSQKDSQDFLQPSLQYEVTVNQTGIPMGIVAWKDEIESASSARDFATAWIRSEQMINLQPGSQLKIRSLADNGVVQKTLLSPNALPTASKQAK